MEVSGQLHASAALPPGKYRHIVFMLTTNLIYVPMIMYITYIPHCKSKVKVPVLN
jgi:hypothetical protein